MRELFLKIFKIFSAQVVAAVCMGIILLLTARSLGPYGRGIIATLVAFSTLVARLVSMSLGVIVISENQGGIDRKQLAHHFSIVLSYSLIAIGVTLLISIVFYHFDFYQIFSEISLQDFVAGIIAIPFLLWEEYASNFLTSLNRVETYNRNMVEGRLLGLLAIVVLMLSGYLTITSTLLVLCGVRVYASAAGWVITRKVLQQKLSFTLKGIMPILLDGMKLHLMPLGILLLSNADILLVKSFCGLAVTGQYQFASQITTLILLAVHAASMVFMSKLSEAPAHEIWQRYRGTIYLFIMSVVVMAVMFGMITPMLIATFVGPEFTQAGTLFLWMLAPMILKSISLILTHQWVGRKLYWQASVVTVLIGAINIVLALILLPMYGVVGAIVAAAVAYAVSMLLNIAMIYLSNRSVARMKMQLREEQT